MWQKVSVSLTKQAFLFIQEKIMQVRAFERYIPIVPMPRRCFIELQLLGVLCVIVVYCNDANW